MWSTILGIECKSQFLVALCVTSGSARDAKVTIME